MNKKLIKYDGKCNVYNDMYIHSYIPLYIHIDKICRVDSRDSASLRFILLFEYYTDNMSVNSGCVRIPQEGYEDSFYCLSTYP